MPIYTSYTYFVFFKKYQQYIDSLDGKNPAPVEAGSLSNYLQCFIHPRWFSRISEPSTVLLPGIVYGLSHLASLEPSGRLVVA